MDLSTKLDGNKSSTNGSESDMARITEMLSNKISLEPPTVAFSGESRYLTYLWVFENGDPRQQHHRSESSQSTSSGFDPKGNKLDSVYQNIQERIKALLKLLSFREPRVIVQFWSSHFVGKHQLLTTIDQPFGLGVIDEELCSYRRDSERNPFVVVKDNEEEDRSPPARVFRRGLPEWTCDIANYSSTDFPQKECAIRCNIHGYLALPVFDSTTGVCVGVLELLMSSKYTSYEVQQVHNAMKNMDLITPQALERPYLNVQNAHSQDVLLNILCILKVVCGMHNLPLAQTWAISPLSSFASHNQVVMKSCNSFDTRCLGKVCMSTTGLPFHVQDLKMWPFRKACRERHVDKSRGYVGRALSLRGSCFCGDVTKLSDEDYPLVYNARMSRLSSCLAVFLHNSEINVDYVLEFFLPNSECVPNVVQTLKQKFEEAYGFELGDTSSIQVIGPSTEVHNLSYTADTHSLQMFSAVTTKTADVVEMVSSDSESMVSNVAKSESARIPNEWSSKPIYVGGSVSVSSDAGENSNRLKQSRKRKIDSLTMEAVEQQFGVPIDQAAKTLGVGRTTLRSFCRDHGILSWPLPKYNNKPTDVTSLQQLKNPSLKENIQRSSTTFYVAVLVLVRVKRWSCVSKRHGYSGRWWACGQHLYLPRKLDSLYDAAHIIVMLKRWRNRSSIKNAMQNTNKTVVSESTPIPIHTTNMANVRNVSVKASFKNDMIKFQFPTSLGLSELQNEVAQRFNLNSRMLRIKYVDEDKDMILLVCDADLRYLLGLSTSTSNIRLVISLADG